MPAPCSRPGGRSGPGVSARPALARPAGARRSTRRPRGASGSAPPLTAENPIRPAEARKSCFRSVRPRSPDPSPAQSGSATIRLFDAPLLVSHARPKPFSRRPCALSEWGPGPFASRPQRSGLSLDPEGPRTEHGAALGRHLGQASKPCPPGGQPRRRPVRSGPPNGVGAIGIHRLRRTSPTLDRKSASACLVKSPPNRILCVYHRFGPRQD